MLVKIVGFWLLVCLVVWLLIVVVGVVGVLLLIGEILLLVVGILLGVEGGGELWWCFFLIEVWVEWWFGIMGMLLLVLGVSWKVEVMCCKLGLMFRLGGCGMVVVMMVLFWFCCWLGCCFCYGFFFCWMFWNFWSCWCFWVFFWIWVGLGLGMMGFVLGFLWWLCVFWIWFKLGSKCGLIFLGIYLLEIVLI